MSCQGDVFYVVPELLSIHILANSIEMAIIVVIFPCHSGSTRVATAAGTAVWKEGCAVDFVLTIHR
jgi:hypothetical protein